MIIATRRVVSGDDAFFSTSMLEICRYYTVHFTGGQVVRMAITAEGKLFFNVQ